MAIGSDEWPTPLLSLEVGGGQYLNHSQGNIDHLAIHLIFIKDIGVLLFDTYEFVNISKH